MIPTGKYHSVLPSLRQSSHKPPLSHADTTGVVPSSAQTERKAHKPSSMLTGYRHILHQTTAPRQAPLRILETTRDSVHENAAPSPRRPQLQKHQTTRPPQSVSPEQAAQNGARPSAIARFGSHLFFSRRPLESNTTEPTARQSPTKHEDTLLGRFWPPRRPSDRKEAIKTAAAAAAVEANTSSAAPVATGSGSKDNAVRTPSAVPPSNPEVAAKTNQPTQEQQASNAGRTRTRGRISTDNSAQSMSSKCVVSDAPSHLPFLTVQQTLDLYGDQLTPLERVEIGNYTEIYYVSTLQVKQCRRNGKVYEAPAQGDERSDSTSPAPLHNDGYDDERGDYLVVQQDHLAYRYEVLFPLGSGSFGQVLCCLDHQTQTKVAVKIIRNRKKYKEQSMIEIQLLTHLHRACSTGATSAPAPTNRYIVKMKENFVFRNHLCLTFDLLGLNLYDYLKIRYFQGLSVASIRRIAIQLLESLAFLRTQHIIHCDLKPENVLIQAPLATLNSAAACAAYADLPIESICLIDFGSSCFDRATLYTYIQSRFYRSPEVILGHAYGIEIDMWSFGCILVELFTGHPIFAGENEAEQVACIMEFFGPPPTAFLLKCKRRKQFFDEEEINSTTRSATFQPLPFVNSRGRKRVPSSRNFKTVLRCEDDAFVNFLKRCFTWEPALRMSPEQALQDPWILSLSPPDTASSVSSGSVSATSFTDSETTKPRRNVPTLPPIDDSASAAKQS
ncbi:TPA: hypothetical protein N0F65_004769 [Lagenidium giganteum]|uniref:dual-specificity kinase n=1 Tax=Lagenidium giganteum TaxID=4803 RepID=A0AAV2YST8_9STRA|nr:TPA: hypothetical protein N0F65_004769 [Lagenidium giganteum]